MRPSERQILLSAAIAPAIALCVVGELGVFGLPDIASNLQVNFVLVFANVFLAPLCLFMYLALTMKKDSWELAAATVFEIISYVLTFLLVFSVLLPITGGRGSSFLIIPLFAFLPVALSLLSGRLLNRSQIKATFLAP